MIKVVYEGEMGMSRAKKVVLAIVGVILAMTLVVVGIGVKVYLDVQNSMDRTYESVERTHNADGNKSTSTPDLKQQQPFSVLLLGVDTGEYGRTDQGRSDSMMVAVVNPKKEHTALLSIARDTYVPIVGYGKDDKINHAYAFGGTAMSMDTVESYLDIPINYYVSINMKGLEDLVDAVGGITIGNDTQFTQGEYTFNHGKINLDGPAALAYSRMRKEDPRGDYGRQERQRTIVMAIVKKVLTMDGITNYPKILEAIEANMKTNMSFDDMKKIALDYRSAFGSIAPDQLKGEGFMQDNISYQRVSEDELKRVQNNLKQELR